MEKDTATFTDDEDTEWVTITRDDYNELQLDSNFLHALFVCGVDNWDGYEMAQDMISEGTEF